MLFMYICHVGIWWQFAKILKNNPLENLPLSSRVDHFYDIWHPADPRADRAALFWLIHKQSKAPRAQTR